MLEVRSMVVFEAVRRAVFNWCPRCAPSKENSAISENKTENKTLVREIDEFLKVIEHDNFWKSLGINYVGV